MAATADEIAREAGSGAGPPAKAGPRSISRDGRASAILPEVRAASDGDVENRRIESRNERWTTVSTLDRTSFLAPGRAVAPHAALGAAARMIGPHRSHHHRNHSE